MLLSILLLIFGFILLTKGADYFVTGASALALKFNIPPIVIGLTIVAMGTSAPEAAVSIISALKGANEVAIGNVLGSNIANIFLILGITAPICALTIKKNTIKYEIPFLIFISIVLGLMGFYFHSITRLCAFILLILFSLFLFYLYKIANNVEEVDENAKNIKGLKIFLYIVLGMLALIYGSNCTVDSAVDIAHRLNVSDRIIGLTIIAFGTSLPELVTCIIAGLKKESDLAIGNIIGSNIFNILFVLGVAGVIYPINFNQVFIFDSIIALFAVILLFLYTFKTKTLTKIQGISFIIFYIIYLIYLITK